MFRTAAVIVMSLLAASRRADAADTVSPNAAIPKPLCNSTIAVSLRYSPSSELLHVESANGVTRGGCITLTEIWERMAGTAPVYAVHPGSGGVSDTATGTWLVTEHLWIEDGITLQVKGFVTDSRRVIGFSVWLKHFSLEGLLYRGTTRCS